MAMFDPGATKASVLQILHDADIPSDHQLAVVAGATLVDGQPEAHVIVAWRAGNRWDVQLGAEHTGLGDNLAGFALRYSR